ncbi:HypC/HybG/HupF family hydrogenase formation chaperone [Inmirania thermothiophila]|uniref:Hydrogenase expression/formation protein HypC n=1 Tax=Inmirania thermothiophila TaxID=1750597 RepID=A0A3N1Y139_9GAMM|nr:HypC/HybG/HupF family hydrogenase formation chaperone [Inmirania thermothiophila]ROR32536.1 hydrogenase expression/formation protein HypC [Inmirania thermothiophila]
MCLAVPSQVVAVGEGTAVVEAFGRRREVSLLLLDAPVVPGDYVLVQAGGFAYEKVEPKRAREALAEIEALLGEGGEAPDGAVGW